MLTTGNAGFCADFTNLAPATFCRFCNTETDCEAEFGPGAARVVHGETCTLNCAATGRTACMRPCA
jgi:hypothetical protein